MPKSKKPRHPHKQKAVVINRAINESAVQKAVDMYDLLETKVYMKLHEGLCDLDDFESIRDMLGSWMFTLMKRRKQFESEGMDVESTFERVSHAALTNEKIIKRIRDKGSSTCWTEELEELHSAVLEGCKFAREQFGKCPRTFATEFNAYIISLTLHPNEAQKFTKKKVDYLYDYSTQVNHLSHEQMDVFFDELRKQQ